MFALFIGGRIPANIPLLTCRIPSHDEEILARRQGAMARPRRQKQCIARFDLQLSTAWTNDHEKGKSGRDA